MKHLFYVFAALLLAALPSLRAEAQETDPAQPVREMLARILPENGDAGKFVLRLESQPEGAADYFTLSGGGGQPVTVTAGNNVSLATGINWYLQHHAGVGISWNAPTGKLPAELPAVGGTERHTVSVDYRYYLNFCTHSYTMAFWGWERWQQEIDWMALHGINLPLIITGMECVWKDMLQTEYGYQGLAGVNKFVTGAAYYGWFFMNNMTQWGGPQPESWYTQREELARNIFRRLGEFGMTPVIPGYVGMVPDSFLSYARKNVGSWKASDIVNGGSWNAFTRPYFVNNTERLKEMAAAYYAAVDRVFGDVLSTHFYAIDPFHEGGVPQGVTDASGSVKAMWQALRQYDSQAIWVAQHWLKNPTTLVTHNIPLDRLLILDLHGESAGDTQCSGQCTDATGARHQWVWCMLNNYGGNVGLFGRMERTLTTFNAAAAAAAQSNLKGIGTIPEGIENNPVLFDLVYAMPWRSEPYTLSAWLKDYVRMRYGVDSATPTGEKLLSAWTRLARTIYNCPRPGQQGTTESVFMMRPNTRPGSVSTWASSSWYWDFDEVRTAAFEFIDVSDELKDNANYRYDLVDLVRQCLADKGKELLDSYETSADKNALGEEFLQMILDQDELLGTLSDFRLGRWTEMARALGTTKSEKDLYEKNARMLVTTWGDKLQCDNGALHDYGNREWNGLLSSYYYPRWKFFFDATRNGTQLWPASWFNSYEWPFVTANTSGAVRADLPEGAPFAYGSFSAEAQGDPVETAKRMFEKYFSGFKPLVWTLFRPDPGKSYLLYNVNKWYNAPFTEGVCVAAPNNDYRAGYRLQRATMDTSSDEYRWTFEPSATTEGAYRIRNVAVGRTQYGPYLSSTPSSSGYPAFTLNAEGSEYFVFNQENRFYIRDAHEEIYFAPDCAWATACILTSGSLSSIAYVQLTERALGELEKELQAAREALDRADIMLARTGTGLYRYTDPDGAAAACRQTLSALMADPDVTAEALTEATAALEAALGAMTLHQPATGRFYRLVGREDGKAWRLSSATRQESGSTVLTLETADNGPSTVFYYTPEKSLVAWDKGLALHNFSRSSARSFAAAGTPGAAYTFGRGNAKDTYTLLADGKRALCHDAAGNLVTSGTAASDGAAPDDSPGYDWTIEEVGWMPVRFADEAAYATLYTPVALGCQDRVRAYTATLCRDEARAIEYLELHEIAGGTIPAHQPVILEKGPSYTTDAGTRCVYLPAVSGAASAEGTGALTGSVLTARAASLGGQPYTLGAPEGQPAAFYPHTAATVPGFQAYFLASGSPQASYLFYREGGYTGIGAPETGAADRPRLFDLGGRAAGRPAQGIYVTADGRKILLR